MMRCGMRITMESLQRVRFLECPTPSGSKESINGPHT
jgi:hypothetical protein